MEIVRSWRRVKLVSAKRVFIALLGVCVVVVLARQAAAYYDFLIDDTFISLVYAKNLVHGNGITFNGDYVAGYSNFLWVIALAFLGFLGIDLVLAAKVLGIVCAYGTLALLVIIGKRVLGDVLPGLIAGLLLAVSSSYAIWSVAGLETLGFTFLLLASVYFIAREEQRDTIRWSPLLLAGLALMRPEGIGLAIALVGMRLVSRLLRNGRSVVTRNYIFGNALTFVLYTGFIGWHAYYYGYPFPTTVYAKTGDIQEQIADGIAYLLDFIRETRTLSVLFACCLPLAFLSAKSRLFNAMAVGTIGAQAVFIVLAGGDWMPEYRFVVPVLPLLYLLLAQELVGLSVLYTRISRPLGALVGILAAVFAAWSIWQASALHDDEVLFVARTSRDTVQLAQLMATFVRPEDTIALIDAGAIPYYTGARIIDMVGLNDNYVAHLPGGFMEKYDNQYVLGRRPDFIEMHISGQGADVFSASFIGTAKLYYLAEFHQHYEPIGESPHIFRRRAQPLAQAEATNFYSATYEVVLPTSFPAGVSATLPVTLTNRGGLSWLPLVRGMSWGAVSVVVEWRDAQGRVVLRNDRVRLKRRIRSGQPWSFQLPLKAPSAPGTYTLVFDLARDSIYRFSEEGVPPFSAQVQVR